MDFPDGKTLVKIIRETFGTTDITKEQLNYVLAMLTPSSYVLEHNHIKGKPIMFHVPNRNRELRYNHRPWQLDILNDKFENICVMKSRQLGLSEVMGCERAVYQADAYSYDNFHVLYVLPTYKALTTFIKSRLDPVLNQPYYRSIVNQNNNSLDQKQIRNSMIIFRTGSKAGAVEGVDIDSLYLDEYDRIGSQAEASAIESMSSSKYKFVQRWSTPSVIGAGIHGLFTHGDQRIYMHKCQHCGKVQQIKFDDYDPSKAEEDRGNILCVNPKGIDLVGRYVEDGSYQYVCSHCGLPIDRWYSGRWVVTHPEVKGLHSYLVTQLDFVALSADDMKTKELRATSKQAFHNYSLGLPFTDSSLAITESDIVNNTRAYLTDPLQNRGNYRFISIGIDWGKHFHTMVVMGMTDRGTWDVINNMYIPNNKSVADPEADLKSVIIRIQQYDPDVILPDIGDSGNYVQRLIQLFGADRVFGVWTKSTSKSSGDVVPSFSEGANRVTIDKLTQMLIIIGHIKAGRIGFYRKNTREKQILISHWKNVQILDQEDEQTSETYKVVACKGSKTGSIDSGDHTAFSMLYASVGLKYLMDKYDSSNSSAAFDYTLLTPGVGLIPTDINNGKGY